MEHTYAQCKVDTCVGYRHSGENPLPVKGNQAVKDINKGSARLDMRQARAIWLKRNVREASIKPLLHFDQKSDGYHVGFSTLLCRMNDTLIFF